MTALLYSDTLWTAVIVGSFALLAVGILIDLCRTKKRRLM